MNILERIGVILTVIILVMMINRLHLCEKKINNLENRITEITLNNGLTTKKGDDYGC